MLYGISKKDYPTIEDYVKSAYIIHFAGKDKPWNNKKIPYADIWLKYAGEIKND